MKISEHAKPIFDPLTRVKEGKPMHIIIMPTEWAALEKSYGAYISPTEIKELILGLFSGKFKLVRR